MHDLDEKIPKFTALSYTWGSRSDGQQRILVDGCCINITFNLHAGLTHIREKDSNLVLWIDALCINQDDILERNRQVPLMRDIYMVAETVLVWLGSATENVDASDAAELYQDIAARPYWTRVWVIQEFVLGAKVVIQCGHVRIPWDDFYATFPRKVRRGKSKMTGVFHLRQTYKPRIQGLDMLEALKFSFKSKASDPRDQVYGILGLVQPSRQVPDLKVDYNSSPCQIYLRVYRYINMTRQVPLSQWSECEAHNVAECDGRKCGTLEKLIREC
jgi:hypothetical protein